MTRLCLSSLLLFLLFSLVLQPAASFSGSVYFGGCMEDTCQKGDHLMGYGCRRGNCQLVCSDNDCYHQGVRVRRPSPDESLRLTRFRFVGCSSHHCSSAHLDGYDCELGACRYVCDGAVCHRGNHKKGRGRQRSTMMKSPSISSKAVRFLFEGCLDNICLQGDHHGYGCSSGVCDLVCEQDECYHGDRVYHFDLKGKVKKSIEFDDCQDLNCKNQRGFGFECENGHCAVACDDHQCFRIAASLAEPMSHRGRSPRHMKKASTVFHGCGAERRCQTGSTFGYNCKAGVCDYVCTSDACSYKGKPMLSPEGKEPVKIESLYFDGCLSPFCFKGDFDGFHCNRGHCAFACNDDMCFDAESYDRAFPKPTPPPEPEKSPEEQFDFGKELQQIQFSKFFNFGDTPFF